MSNRELIDDPNPLMFAHDEGFVMGQQSCAASPWTYRDTNGDGSGTVMGDAKLPESKPWQKFLIQGNFCSSDLGVVDVRTMKKQPDWYRKHLIAYAEIQGGEE